MILALSAPPVATEKFGSWNTFEFRQLPRARPAHGIIRYGSQSPHHSKPPFDPCCFFDIGHLSEAVAIKSREQTVRLGDFILENMEAILRDWEDYARRFWEGPLPDRKVLRNHAEVMLRAVVADMASLQTSAEQKAKAEGQDVDQESKMSQAALGHALAG